MSLSIKPWIPLAALLSGSAALAQDPPDQAHYGTRIERPSFVIPELPPCVDGALVGRLRLTGERDWVELTPGHRSPRYWFEFVPRRTLFGPPPPPSLRFSVIGKSDLETRDNAVMLVRREADGSLAEVHVDLAVRDWRGREFIPLIWPPIPELRGFSWLPLDFEAFVRRVHYDRRQMEAYGHGSEWLGNLAAARNPRRWVEWRGERAVVRYGLYLDELESLFRSQRPDRCRQPEPRLAIPGRSR